MPRKYNQVTVSWPQIRLADPRTIEFTLHGSCGTYVRALGYLLARALKTVGHLTQLRRLQIGPYNVADAFDGNLLKTTATETLQQRIEPL